MNREILRLAVPNIISNITVPLMGIVSSAVAGHLDNSAATIGALAIGVSIFNFIYWNCSFVRMGTSGLTAQAFGAGNFHECTNMLVRGILVAAILGLLVICFQNPLGRLALWAMNGNEIVHDYFYARIWAVPAGIMLFGFNGWYTGMQNAVIPMCIAVTVNIVHVSTSLWLVFGHGMGITGIAYGSVVAQNTGVLLAVLLLILRYRKILTRFTWREVVDWEPVRKFFLINRDIIVRTLCIVAVYTFFTAASARMEDPILLTVNTLLLQIFTLFSYMNDGFAYAAEALTGRFIGARDEQSLRRCLGRCLGWGTLISVLFVGIYLIWWRDLLGIFIKAGTPDAAQVVSTAGNYIVWIILIPLASAMPFIMDGIMVGATETKVMRNSMLLQIFTLFSYMNDGFAYAAEALTGRFIGARDEQSLRRCLGRCLGWGTLISVLFVGIYLIWWRDLLGIFIKAGTPDAAQVVSTAGNYIVWIILIPLASAMPFIMDGIMVGATETKVMRNSMLLSTVAYFGIFYSLYPVIGNNALWLAFTLYMFLRGTLQLLMTRRLRLIYRKAAA